MFYSPLLRRAGQSGQQTDECQVGRIVVEALGLNIYERHPDDERNYVILLDYAGTYAAQVAYAKEESFDEALDFIHRACDIAKEKQMTDLMRIKGRIKGTGF